MNDNDNNTGEVKWLWSKPANLVQDQQSKMKESMTDEKMPFFYQRDLQDFWSLLTVLTNLLSYLLASIIEKSLCWRKHNFQQSTWKCKHNIVQYGLHLKFCRWSFSCRLGFFSSCFFAAVPNYLPGFSLKFCSWVSGDTPESHSGNVTLNAKVEAMEIANSCFSISSTLTFSASSVLAPSTSARTH